MRFTFVRLKAVTLIKKYHPYFILLPVMAFSQASKPWLDYRFPSIIADNQLWIGTPSGLFLYHEEEDTWSLFGSHNGLAGDEIRVLRWDNEYLWVLTPEGLSQGDIRLNKWLTYTTDDGLPGNKLFSIEFQGDYAWIGTNRGAARYDKLIQEWEIFDETDGLPDSLIYDIAVNEDVVYFGSGHGLAEYDVNFEKWRYFTKKEGLPSDTIRYIYQTTEDLWLFTPAGPCLFNKQRCTVVPFVSDERLQYKKIRYFLADNTRFWVASDSAVLNYDPNSAVWREYQESVNLPSMQVNGISLSTESSWFVTRAGVAMRDEDTGNWRYFDRTHGLSADEYQRVIYFRGKSFLISAQTIDYYKPDEERWYNHPIRVQNEEKRDRIPRFSLDREHGSYFKLNDAMRLSLNGTRITRVYKSQDEYSIQSDVWKGSQESGDRMDVKAQLSLGSERTVNGFYNNVDETQVMYGVRYRGAGRDLLQEAQWGDIRFEKGKQELAVSTGLFGGAFRAEAGPKTKQYKRSRFSIKGFSGERTSAREIEFLTGNLKSGFITRKDIDYMSRIFFATEIPGNGASIDPGQETLYLDDGLSGTDTDNTQILTLAGIEGNYDRLMPVLDYALDASGFIRMMNPVPENATLILHIPGSGDYVLFHQTEGSECVNRYALSVREILPYSFQLFLYDTLGFQHELRSFGLDENGDGIVDPERMDYHQGILTFPLDRPFPDIVYGQSPVSCYRMEISFESELSFFTLKHDSLIRGTETVMIDGEILTPGQDYVLDYTVGSLVIVKEGILAENSEIEIDYEYYFNPDARFHSAGLGLGLSDNCLIEANGFAFDSPDPGQPETRGFNAYSELKGRLGPWNFRLTPEFSRTQTGQRDGNALYLRSDFSTEKCRIFGITERIGRDHTLLSARKFQMGNLKEQDKIGLTFYPAAGLDITGQWQRQEAQATGTGYLNQEENQSGKILFSRSGIPAMSVSFRNQFLNSENTETRKRNLKTEMEYIVPHLILSSLSMQSLRFYWVWRHSLESDSWKNERHKVSALYDNLYFRMDLSPAHQIQLNGYYRGLRMRSADGNFPGRLLNQAEKVFADAVMDRVKGLNVNVRYQGEIQESAPQDSKLLRQFTLYRRVESSVRIFPGQWFSPASAFSFQISVQPFWQGSLSNVDRSLSLKNKFWSAAGLESLTSSTDNLLIQLTGEWRPDPGWLLYSRYDRQKICSSSMNSSMSIFIHRFSQKIEMRPLLNTLLTMQYFRTEEDRIDYSKTIRDNPMLWIERRWSECLQTKFNITYWRENRIQGKIRENAYTLSPLAGLTFRFLNPAKKTIRSEIRNDFSATFYRKETAYADQSQNVYSNNLSLDIYPASVFIARGRWVITYIDWLHSDLDMISNLLELRLTAQF